MAAGHGMSAQTAEPSVKPSPARPPWQTPPDKFVSVMGHRIHYYEKGSGPTLLLVHGFSGSASREWGRVIDLLAERHHVVALHQVGFAPSDQPEIVYDTAAFVGHLGAFIRTLNLRSVVLVGESFGGWVAASYAVEVASGKSKLPPIEKLVIAAGAIGVVKLPPETATNVFDTQVQIEMREIQKRYPRLDSQRTIKLALARTMKGSRIMILPDVGHIVAVESPAEFARLVTEFARN